MDIIDRDIETKEIIKLANNSESTEALILCGESGFGKSTIAKKLSFVDNFERELLYLKSPLLDSVEEGRYIWIFFKTLYKKYNQKAYWFKRSLHMHTYGYFVNKFYKKNHNKSLKETIQEFPETFTLLGGIKLIFTIIEFLITPFIKIFSIYRIPKYEKDKISQYVGYISYIIRQSKTMIILDNIQNIDLLSKKYLFQCISNLSNDNVFFLLEYTISKENVISLADLRDLFENYNIRYTFYKINQLDIDNAYETVKIYKPKEVSEDIFQMEVGQYYYRKSKGNLKDLLSYAITYNDPEKYETGTKTLLMNLKDESSIYIFTVIALNNGQIQKKMLFDLFKTSEFNLFLDIKSGLALLLEENLVEEVEEYIYISHTSTIKTWKQLRETQVFSKYIYNILNELKVYYENIYKTENYIYITRNECFLLLIQIYFEINPLKIYSFANELEKLAGNLLTPRRALNYYKKCLEILYAKREDYLPFFYRAFHFCCAIELYEDSYKILNSIKDVVSDQQEYNINYALILCLLNKYEQSLEFISMQIVTDNRIRLYYYLIELINYRMLNQNSKCFEIANIIEDHKQDYVNYREYAYFLCLADLYKSKKEAIKSLKKGIYLLEKVYNLSDEAYRFRISLSYVYGSLYNHQKALTLLKKTKQYVNNQILYKAIFYNNSSAYNLLMHNYDQQVSDDLNIAEDYANDPFSKLVILNNHLIWCMEKEKFDMGNFIYKNILKCLDTESEKQLISLVYYNLFLFFEKQNKNELAELYYQKAKDLADYSCNLRWRFSYQGPLTKEQLKIISNPWNVCFLARWEFSYLPE